MPEAKKHTGDARLSSASTRASKKERQRTHDLSNELAVIHGYATLATAALQRLLETAGPKIQPELQAILRMIERISESAEQGRRLFAPAAAAAATASATPPNSARRSRVLAVDDSPPLLALLHKVLSQAGFTVDAFGDPAAALLHFAEAPPNFDLIITDAVMPSLSGAALGAKIRAIRPDIPIIVCTGSAGFRDESAAGWAQAVIHKPYHSHALAALARKTIEGA